MLMKKVISGGQTGVDRAGLDAAMEAGIPTGGYCPRDRRAEDSRIPDMYSLQELVEREFHFRTEKNVIESDGTLILNKGPLSEGTRLTYDYALQHGKPVLVVQLDSGQLPAPPDVVRWIHVQQISTLNIAGPRESKFPEGVYLDAYEYLRRVFLVLKHEITAFP